MDQVSLSGYFKGDVNSLVSDGGTSDLLTTLDPGPNEGDSNMYTIQMPQPHHPAAARRKLYLHLGFNRVLQLSSTITHMVLECNELPTMWPLKHLNIGEGNRPALLCHKCAIAWALMIHEGLLYVKLKKFVVLDDKLSIELDGGP